MIYKKYLFYDVNDTLVNSSESRDKALEGIAKLISSKCPGLTERKIIDTFIDVYKSVKYFAPHDRKLKFLKFGKLLEIEDSGLVEKASDLYDRIRLEKTKLLPGAFKVLRHFDKKDKIQYAFTNSPDKYQKAILRKLKIFGYFEDVITSEKIGMSKPKKEAFEYIIEAVNGEIESMLLIENSETNAAAAKRLGIDVVLYTDRRFRFFGPRLNYKIRRLEDLIRIVE